MALKLFGIEIISDKQVPNSPIAMDVVQSDSSVILQTSVAAPNALGFEANINGLNLDVNIKEENELINEYRNLLLVPEVDMCLDEIVQEAIIFPKDGTQAINIDLSNLDEKQFSEAIKEAIHTEFNYIYDLLMFNRKGHSIFKRWLVDSRLNYYKNIDYENLQEGIQSLQFIDPRKIKKISETNRVIDKETSKLIINNYKEYFHYDDSQNTAMSRQEGHGVNSIYSGMHLKNMSSVGILTRDSVAYVPSGITDSSGRMVIGYLHKALKVANNLKMMEDSMLIYRLSRAPERRIFYIDTGNLPKAKAEQYVKEIADKYKTKTAYDINTGKIKNDRAFMALTEDFWLARGGGSTGTSIDTLPGGTNGGDTSEVDYFKNKLFSALGVPASRFSNDQSSYFSAGTIISRDEVRFFRMIERMRSSFNVLFQELLGTQLILKNIINPDDWDAIQNKISYIYSEDNYFKEQIRTEKMAQLANMLPAFDAFAGRYLSKEYIYKKVIGLTEEEIDEIKKQIKAESSTDEHMQTVVLNNQLAQTQMKYQIANPAQFMDPQYSYKQNQDA